MPTVSDIQTAQVTLPNDSIAIEAYLAQPAEGGSYPAVIVFQEIFGVNAHIQDVTERIAREGYVAIAPNIFQRTAPGLNLSYTDEDMAKGRHHKDQTTADQLLSDLQAVIAYLKTLPTVQIDRLGTIGFCFGGHVAYLAATQPQIKATASFYGAGIAVGTPGEGAPTITRTREIQGTLYAFFGNQDPLIPNEEVDQIEAELQAQGIQHKLFRYEATHGFFCDRRGTYNPEAAADAWEHVKALFATL